MNYFDDPSPAYLTVKGDTFKLREQTFTAVRVMLAGLQPVRKRFVGSDLACYSANAKQNRHGAYCAFCEVRNDCQRKLRLSLLFLSGPEPEPIFFELNASSYATLRTPLERHGEHALRTEILSMRIVYDDRDRRRIEFSLV